MFPLTNKALIWVGKGQKKKSPGFITTEGCMGELWYQGCPPRIGRPSKSEWYQGRVSPTRIRVSAILHIREYTIRKRIIPLRHQNDKTIKL